MMSGNFIAIDSRCFYELNSAVHFLAVSFFFCPEENLLQLYYTPLAIFLIKKKTGEL